MKELPESESRFSVPGFSAVYHHKSVTSTMDLARQWCEAQGAAPTTLEEAASLLPIAFLADEQTAGRGRQGRRWVHTKDDDNQPPLMATFLLPCHREIAALAGYSLAVGVAISFAWDEVQGGINSSPLFLKWPNDIVAPHARLNGAFGKVGGVLIEVLPLCSGHALSVGIGINTTSTPADVPEALALSELKAGNVRRDDLFLQLARELLEMHSGFMVEGFSRFRATWTARSAFVVKKTRISIDLGGEVVSGLYAGISDSGALRIMDASLVDSVMVASEAERGEREIHSGHIVHWERFYG